MHKVKILINRMTRVPRWLVLILLLAVIGLFWLLGRSSTMGESIFEARRGPLVVSVLEGGTIQALESQVIRSEIEGRNGTTILRIVEEGYQVTEQDIAGGLVLVELDSSNLRERIISQETDVHANFANLTEQVKVKEVRENRSLSELKNANLQKKFALMDFQKYLGDQAAAQVLNRVGINEEAIDRLIAQNRDGPIDSPSRLSQMFTELYQPQEDPNSQNSLAQNGNLSSGVVKPEDMNNVESLLPEIKDYDFDFSIFASDENEHLLGDGQARQELRRLKDALLITEAELALKKKTYEGAVRLASEGYMTSNELEEKKITFEKSQNDLQSARASLELFKTYDLQKTAEQYLLNYEQALLELARVKSDALAELSDALSDVEWAKRRFRWEKRQLDDLNRQLSKCVIHAERQGLVVYGDGKETWDPDEIIREGATVRERQAIITIPDMRKMALLVKIHETQVKRIRTGLPVRITVDAEPEEELTGVVHKVAVLPDSESQRFNPDQKVYETMITIDDVYEWLKPGMNAKAEIIVKELEDVVYIPLQAVMPYQDGQACFVKNGQDPVLRRVEVMDYNNRFVAVKSGLEEGELVYLHVPEGVDLTDEPDSQRDGEGSDRDSVSTVATLTKK
jgi:multidrug resistance efflux pump